MSFSRSALLVLVSFATVGSVEATTYCPPTDFDIFCLDGASGRVLWRTHSHDLVDSDFELVDGVVVAGTGASLRALDALTGAEVPLSRLNDFGAGRSTNSLEDDSDRVLESSVAPTTSLYTHFGETIMVLRNQKWVALARFDESAMISQMEGQFLASFAGSAKVAAFDADRGKLNWVFRPDREFSEPPESGRSLSAAWLDGMVVISFDQAVFALDPIDGRLRWRVRLPRQKIRKFDSPWSKFGSFTHSSGKSGRMLVVICYERVFAIDGSTGELRWWFDAGPHSNPWLTEWGGRLYLAARANNPVGMLSDSGQSFGPPTASVVRVSSSTDGIRIEPTFRRLVPPKSHLYWSQDRPPDAQRLVVLRIDGRRRRTEYDLTQPLTNDGEVFVEVPEFSTRAVVVMGRDSRSLDLRHLGRFWRGGEQETLPGLLRDTARARPE
ncbi:MAG: PQQ-binding-like beta-propeller repeat protein [Deltaproteobacteria bacterium]|nr:PQQ-binding-like beta-propeller repeat protein [Deltaproteobacteria bacterium]